MGFSKLCRSFVFFAVAALFASQAYCQGFGAGEQKPESALKVLSHVDLNITRVRGLDEAGVTFHGGAIGVYKFSPFIGMHLGAQFNRIAASEFGVDFTADYIDIPFGLTINYGNGFQGSSNFINIGGFYGLPIGEGKLSAEGSEDVELETDGVFGINFGTHTLWPVSDKVSIGLHAFFKFGLKEMFEVEGEITDTKYYAAGIGISAAFL
jgi:hypothetical protein